MIVATEKTVKWYEVWAGYAFVPPALVFLWEDLQGNIEVYSPSEKRVWFYGSSYEDARIWLSEDEYHLVGRIDDEDTVVPA